MYKIVVPTDFSPLSEYALDVAIDIARKTNGAVFLLNVMSTTKNYSFSSTGGGAIDMVISEEDRYISRIT